MKSLSLFVSVLTQAQKTILINDVQFSMVKMKKHVPAMLLIVNNLISKISIAPIATNRSANTVIIDGKGKFLMPGLIDAHAHTLMDALPFNTALTSDIAYINLYAVSSSEKQLLRGFTSVRDVGGNSFSLKRSIDEGLVKGPRIYPSGGGISQSGGHGDFGLPTDVPKQTGSVTYIEKVGMSYIADGVDQVLLRTRENLRSGASQIKLMAGGGVASVYDPLDVMQYTEAELKAAVNAAANWGTYVTVHAYTPEAIKAAIDAGVKCIEHGQLTNEESAKIMADKGIWLCLQPFLDDEDAIPYPPNSESRRKQVQLLQGTENAYKLAKKYKIKTAFGTDCLFDAKLASRQGFQLAKLSRWYTPFEVLKMATSDNAELLALSGLRNPYQAGKLGVIAEGAYADLILVDGNPLQNITLITDPDKNFLLIMKDGVIYKNAVK